MVKTIINMGKAICDFEEGVGNKVNPIDEYIVSQDEVVQSRLNLIRDTFRSAIPEATEKISYQMPTYWKGRNIIHGRRSNHVFC